jgi:hypothetical protein
VGRGLTMDNRLVAGEYLPSIIYLILAPSYILDPLCCRILLGVFGATGAFRAPCVVV